MSEVVDPLWYKDAVVYQLHVKAFSDSSGDGIGDFLGLTKKLDYLVDLGVTAVWLLPFYPSPLRDDGYDIADYKRVHPDYGTMRDFRTFVREAHERGLKVITELVINHTSDQHPWFQRARRARAGSKYRDYYVWSDTDEKYWAWDPVAHAYYWHRFFSHQPDLNWDNPRVFDEITSVMKFWLDAGVDGLRLDAIPYLVEREGTNNENLAETHAVIRRLRAWLDANFADRMFLAEANQWPEDVRPYFGDGDECHMAFHFPVMPRIYMALARADRYPITDIMRQTPDIPDNCQWAIFLRNHDELTLEMVTPDDRQFMWEHYSPEMKQRINLGIRRRLAPLMDNDQRRIELMNSMLFTLPGTPVLYYGDEIGMGDNIKLFDRNGVRTPMQWKDAPNGGFSEAPPESLYAPSINDPVYGYHTVNVESQMANPESLLHTIRRMIHTRKQYPVLASGELVWLDEMPSSLLCFQRVDGNKRFMALHNLTDEAVDVTLPDDGQTWCDAFETETTVGETVTLPPYGYRWLTPADSNS